MWKLSIYSCKWFAIISFHNSFSCVTRKGCVANFFSQSSLVYVPGFIKLMSFLSVLSSGQMLSWYCIIAPSSFFCNLLVFCMFTCVWFCLPCVYVHIHTWMQAYVRCVSMHIKTWGWWLDSLIVVNSGLDAGSIAWIQSCHLRLMYLGSWL